MVVNKKAAAKQAESKPARKRTVKTQAQRIEEARAKLAALEAAGSAKARKRIEAIDDKLAKLEPKIADLQKQVDALNAEKAEAESEASESPVTDGVGEV